MKPIKSLFFSEIIASKQYYTKKLASVALDPTKCSHMNFFVAQNSCSQGLPPKLFYQRFGGGVGFLGFFFWCLGKV